MNPVSGTNAPSSSALPDNSGQPLAKTEAATAQFANDIFSPSQEPITQEKIDIQLTQFQNLGPLLETALQNADASGVLEIQQFAGQGVACINELMEMAHSRVSNLSSIASSSDQQSNEPTQELLDALEKSRQQFAAQVSPPSQQQTSAPSSDQGTPEPAEEGLDMAVNQ